MKLITCKTTIIVAILALVCSAYSWDDTFPVYVNITKKHMDIGAMGGHMPDIFYTTLLDRYGSRYVVLHKEDEDDPGRIVWALYSENNGMLDSVIVDEKGNPYTSVGDGADGRIPPPLEEKLKHRHLENVVVAPLSVFDAIAVNLENCNSDHCLLCDHTMVTFVLELDNDRKSFIRRLQSYEPLLQRARKAGFSVFNFALICGEMSCGDLTLFQEMFNSVGLEMPLPPKSTKLTQPPSTGGDVLRPLKNTDKDFDKALKEVLKEIEKLGTTKVKRKKR